MDFACSSNNDANASGSGGDEPGGTRTLCDRAGAFLQILFRCAAGRLEFHAALEHVQFRPPLLHLEPKCRAQIRHVHLRSADAKSLRLRRHFGDEPAAAAGSLARRNESEVRPALRSPRARRCKKRLAPNPT